MAKWALPMSHSVSAQAPISVVLVGAGLWSLGREGIPFCPNTPGLPALSQFWHWQSQGYSWPAKPSNGCYWEQQKCWAWNPLCSAAEPQAHSGAHQGHHKLHNPSGFCTKMLKILSSVLDFFCLVLSHDNLNSFKWGSDSHFLSIMHGHHFT